MPAPNDPPRASVQETAAEGGGGGGGTFANETILSGRPIEKSERERERMSQEKIKKERKRRG